MYNLNLGINRRLIINLKNKLCIFAQYFTFSHNKITSLSIIWKTSFPALLVYFAVVEPEGLYKLLIHYASSGDPEDQ